MGEPVVIEQRSVPPTRSDRGSVSALMLACQNANIAEVRQLIQSNPPIVNGLDRTGKTALHYCSENTSLACAEELLTVEPRLLDIADEEGYTALHLAVINGNKILVQFLITKNADVNAIDLEKHSLIHWATVCGEIECLDLLVAAGANSTTPDMHGAYPLHYAAQMCGPKNDMGQDTQTGMEVLKRLLFHGADVRVRDQDGREPLLWAASAGTSDGMLALVNAGASVKTKDKDGLTALHCAASRGHNDCLETLLSLCGMDVDVEDNNGCTALFYAVTLGHADCTALLLRYLANPNHQDLKGRTPAHCGAAKGQLETLKILEKNLADLWKENYKGDLPLHEAVQSGRKELLLWLLSLRPGAPNYANKDGRTCLHIAAINNNVELCKILIDDGAEVNPVMRNNKGQMMTPMDAALFRGNRGCANYLQLHGGRTALKIGTDRERESDPGNGAAKGPPDDQKQAVNEQQQQQQQQQQNAAKQQNSEHLVTDSQQRPNTGGQVQIPETPKTKDQRQNVENQKTSDQSLSPRNSENNDQSQNSDSSESKNQRQDSATSKSKSRRQDSATSETKSQRQDSATSETKSRRQDSATSEAKSRRQDSAKSETKSRRQDSATSETKRQRQNSGTPGAKNQRQTPSPEKNTQQQNSETPATSGQDQSSEQRENLEQIQTSEKPKSSVRIRNTGAGSAEDSDLPNDENDDRNQQDDDRQSIYSKNESIQTEYLSDSHGGEIPKINENDVKEHTGLVHENSDHENDNEIEAPLLTGSLNGSGRRLERIPEEEKDGLQVMDNNEGGGAGGFGVGGLGGRGKKASGASSVASEDTLSIGPSVRDSGFSDNNRLGWRSDVDDSDVLSSPAGITFIDNGEIVKRRPRRRNNNGRKDGSRAVNGDRGRVADSESDASVGNDDEISRVYGKGSDGQKLMTKRNKSKGENKAIFRPKTGEKKPMVSSSQRALNNRIYQKERRIFQELLELKRVQLNADRAEEEFIVRKLSDSYRHQGLIVNHLRFDGPYTFQNYEKYLYEQLRQLSGSVGYNGPASLRSPYDAAKEIKKELEDSPSQCTQRTYHCHHATHSYMGVPCVAYLKNNRGMAPILPKINAKSPPSSQKSLGKKKSKSAESLKDPVVLEIKHGGNVQTFALPTGQLDKNKKYQLTFTLGPSGEPNGNATAALKPMKSV